MRVRNDGERCDFLSETGFLRDSVVSGNHENRTICKP
jgi:hypothetical protein